MKRWTAGHRGGVAALLLGGILALAGQAPAQEVSVEGASPDASHVAPPETRAPPVDPERLALARELFTTMHLDTNLRGALGSVFRSMPNMAGSGSAAARAQKFGESFSTALEASFPDLIDSMASVYARTLTKQELNDSLTFYRSPSGQAILSKLPEMMRQAMPMTMQMMPRIAAAAERDFCSRETCSETERAVFRRMQTTLAQPGAGPAGTH